MQAHVSSRPIFWIFVRIYIYLCMSPRSTYRCIFVATEQNFVIGIDKTYNRQLMTFWSRHIFQQSVDSLSFYEIEILDQGETGCIWGSQSGHEILYHNPARLEFRWEEHNVRSPHWGHPGAAFSEVSHIGCIGLESQLRLKKREMLCFPRSSRGDVTKSLITASRPNPLVISWAPGLPPRARWCEGRPSWRRAPPPCGSHPWCSQETRWQLHWPCSPPSSSFAPFSFLQTSGSTALALLLPFSCEQRLGNWKFQSDIHEKWPMILITEQDHQQNHKDYLNMPMKTMMTMPAMSTGKRPEKAKAAMARSVLVGAWFNAILRMITIMIIVIMMMIDIEILMNNNSFDLKFTAGRLTTWVKFSIPPHSRRPSLGEIYPSAQWSSRKAPIIKYTI